MRRASRANSSCGRGLGRRDGTTRGALLTRAIDLDDALARREAAGRRHLLDERLDVRAQELGRAVAGLADQVEVTRMPVGMLEAIPPLAKVHLARNARLDHPLQRPVDGRTADATVLAGDQVHEIVGADVPVLPQEDVDDEVALPRPLAPFGSQAVNESGGGLHGVQLSAISYQPSASSQTAEPTRSVAM